MKLLPNPLASGFGRKAAFFLLYVTEGLPHGFSTVAVATQMRFEGLAEDRIATFVAVLSLPWALKWIVAPFVDLVYSDFLGRRRGWILGTQVLMAAAMLLLQTVSFQSDLMLFTALVLLINFFASTQDVAIDALACGVLEEHERGTVNGLMFAGAYAGAALGGSGALFLLEYVNLNIALLVVTACVLVVTGMIVLPMREPRSLVPLGDRTLRTAARKVADYVRNAGRAFFGERRARVALIFALLPTGAYGVSMAITSNLSVELGLSKSLLGWLSLVSQVIAGVCCVVGGWLSDRFGRRLMLTLYVTCTAIPTALLAGALWSYGWISAVDPTLPGRPVAPWGLLAVFWGVSLTYSVFQGLLTGTRTALFMDLCDPQVAATQFTAYMAVLNLVIGYSNYWQGQAVKAWGYPTTFTLDAVFGLLSLLPLLFMSPVGKKPESPPD